MADNQLQTIVAESGLETTKARVILEQFEDSFAMAEEWEIKAKAIVVTDGSQVDAIAQAREGRLFLREKRIAIEKTRKELKEQSLREGKAIDGIANVLKALILPLEKHLDNQENFVKYKAEAEAAERERVFQENEKKRLAEEAEAKRIEDERIRAENEQLRKEAEERDAKLKKAELEKQLVERKANRERAAAQKEADDKLAAERAKAEEARRAEVEARAKEEAERKRLEAELAAQVECPNCGHKFAPKARKRLTL